MEAFEYVVAVLQMKSQVHRLGPPKLRINVGTGIGLSTPTMRLERACTYARLTLQFLVFHDGPKNRMNVRIFDVGN